MNEFIKYCKDKKFLIALGLMLLYVLPLVFYSIPYIDDLGRQSSGSGWNHDGRIFATVFMKILSLNDNFIADFSPLPLLIGLIFICLCAYYLCYKYKIESLLAIYCISLSLLISPFYLENLSYKFDSLGMSSSVALAVFTGIFAIKNKITFLNAIYIFILIFAICATYQASINLFVIVFLFGIYDLLAKNSNKEIIKRIILVAFISFIALLFYKWISTFYVRSGYSLSHADSVPFKLDSFAVIFKNIKIYLTKSFDIYNYKIYGRISLVFFLLSFILLFIKSNFKQKIYLPFLYVFSVIFICGVLMILKSPVFAPRTFIGLIGIYVIIVFALASASSKKFLYLAVFFIFMHFIQAYSYYNALNKQYQQEKYLYNLMSLDIEQTTKEINKIKIIGKKTREIPSSKTFKVIDSLVPHYINNHFWHGIAFFREYYFVNYPTDNSNIEAPFLKNCDNVLYYHQAYNAYLYGQTMVFDFNKTCKQKDYFLKQNLQNAQKITLEQNLKADLKLEALYFYEENKANNLVFEFNHNLLDYALKTDNILYMHIYKQGEKQFINKDQNINNFTRLGDKFYYQISLGDLNFSEIEKINFGFYDSKAKKSSVNFTLRILKFLDENYLNGGLKNSKEIFKNENVQLLINENYLLYFYKDCQNQDLATRFFLHFYPEDKSKLPESNKQGFLNMDFSWKDFDENIKIFKNYENSCLALRKLPEFKIKTLNTGQYNAQGRTWESKIISL